MVWQLRTVAASVEPTVPATHAPANDPALTYLKAVVFHLIIFSWNKELIIPIYVYNYYNMDQ